MYLTRLTLSALVASCVFGYSLEPDQSDNMNFVTIWHSGGILDYVLELLIKRNWADFKKACKITQHANTLTELEVSRFNIVDNVA